MNLFKGSHYHLIRTNPEYRMRIIAEEMMLNSEPAWAQPQTPSDFDIYDLLEPTVIHTTHIHTHRYQPKKQYNKYE